MSEASQQIYRIRLTLEPQPEGGYTVTSPDLPELLTEGDTLDEVLANVQDAFRAVAEIYEETGRTLPREILAPVEEPLSLDALVALP